MEVSSLDPSPMAMDLSKGFSVNPLTSSHIEAMDLAKRPEWYHRHPPNCSPEVNTHYSTRSRTASSYSSLSSRIMDSSMRDAGVIQLHPEVDAPVHCRDMEHGPETIGSYMNSTLAQGLGLYHEGVHRNLWHTRFYGPDPTESAIPESSGEEESDSGSDVIFLVSTTKDSLVCSSLSRESASPVVEPLSPAALSLDEGRGCFLLPQTLSSPSPDSTCSEDSSDSSVEIPVHHTRPVVLLSDLSVVYGNPAESPVDISSEDSDVVEVQVTNEKKRRHTFLDNFSAKKSLAGETCRQNEGYSPQPRELRRSARIRKSTSEIHEFTRSVSQHNLRSQTKNTNVGLYSECYDSGDMMESMGRFSSSEEESLSQTNLTQRESSSSDDSDVDTQTASKAPSKSPQSESPQSCCKALNVKTVKQKLKKSVPNLKSTRFRTKQKAHHRIPTAQRPNASAGGKAPASKSAGTNRRRKKRTQTGPSTLFSPREPEIKLKYAQPKQGKKDNKANSFSPFVRMERRVCTVVNYQEDQVSVRRNGTRHPRDTGSLSGFVPKTSCFQIGRLSSESKHQPTQICYLCGQSANAMGLGDLHGPYYPTGPPLDRPSQQQNGTGLSPDDWKNGHKEEERLDGLGDSRAVKPEDKCCGYDGSFKLSVKRSAVLDSHSLTAVPLRTEECWIHEDCGVWSAGVFLVKGRLYGLGEAARLAQETFCSTCHEAGAIMGCFQKGCPKNYHYRCGLLSGCVLNEENFSMRCSKHKNKLFRTVNSRQDDR
ncbi:uncharacterized protein ACJ7VT_021390 isoform 1-T2 [Polymixia lowei]